MPISSSARRAGSGTAAFFAPYADDPTTSGLLIQSPAALEKKVFDADAAGFQVIVHAIGDRANAVVLDIFEKLQQARGARDRRPRIEHAQVVRDADKLRFAKAGVIASIQPSHCIDDMRWAEKRIGRARCAIAYDFKSFVDLFGATACRNGICEVRCPGVARLLFAWVDSNVATDAELASVPGPGT